MSGKTLIDNHSFNFSDKDKSIFENYNTSTLEETEGGSTSGLVDDTMEQRRLEFMRSYGLRYPNE